MALNLLTVRKIEAAQPRDKAYSLQDGGSLFLRVQTNGSKLWWYRYRLGDAAKIFSIGVFPKVSLEAARKDRDWARALVREESRRQFEAMQAALPALNKDFAAKGWPEIRIGPVVACSMNPRRLSTEVRASASTCM